MFYGNCSCVSSSTPTVQWGINAKITSYNLIKNGIIKQRIEAAKKAVLNLTKYGHVAKKRAVLAMKTMSTMEAFIQK